MSIKVEQPEALRLVQENPRLETLEVREEDQKNLLEELQIFLNDVALTLE